MKFLLAIIIASVADANNSQSNVLDVFKARATSSCAERQTEGPICTDCDTLALCTKSGNNWITTVVENCVAPQKCNIFEAACSDNTATCPENPSAFVCPASGLFPDTVDCQKYYFCGGAATGGIPMECGGNQAFNVEHNACDINLVNYNQCSDLLVNCTELLQRGRWPNSKKLWYVCVRKDGNLVPSLNICPRDEEFDPVSKGCVIPLGITVTSQQPITSQRPIVCLRYGNMEDPASCYHYYSCSIKLIATHGQCKDNYYYNKFWQACIYGNCPY